MKAILVLVGMAGVLYGVIVLMITFGFALQADPSLEGAAWRAAVLERLTGNFVIGLVLGIGGLFVGFGLIGWVRLSDRREGPPQD